MKEVQDLGAGADIKKPFLMEKIGFAFKRVGKIGVFDLQPDFGSVYRTGH